MMMFILQCRKEKKIKSILVKRENYEEEIFINKSLIFCAGGLGNPHLLLNLISKVNGNLGQSKCSVNVFKCFIQKKYECSYCDKEFTSKQGKYQHEKKYCKIQKNFTNLYQHKSTI